MCTSPLGVHCLVVHLRRLDVVRDGAIDVGTFVRAVIPCPPCVTQNGIEDGDNSVDIVIWPKGNKMGNGKSNYVHVHEISSWTVVSGLHRLVDWTHHC